jgi:hypothetical protein
MFISNFVVEVHQLVVRIVIAVLVAVYSKKIDERK